MTISVTPTDANPTHHASLSDGTTTIGINLSDGRGNLDHRAIQRYALERSAIKTTTGSTKYSDFDLPWMSIAQDDWSGGRGAEDYDEDTSRFFDNFGTQVLDSGIILGGEATYSYGHRSLDQSAIASMAFYNLYSTTRYRAATFTASASYSADKIELWIKKVGTPGTLTAEIWTDSGGEPDALLGTATGTQTASAITDVFGERLVFSFTSAQALVATTTYHVVVYGAAMDDASNYWQVGAVEVAGHTSVDGSTWAASVSSPYFRVTIANADKQFRFFEYKKALYCVTIPESGANSFLYINGDRGAADSNSADKAKLNDATKTWTADEWIGAIALIISGPGSEESQPWRAITDNDTTSLTVYPSWNIAHTTSTEYVILKTNKWTSLLDVGALVTDVAVTGDFVYFARGEGTNVLRYQAYNNAGAWTARNAAESSPASRLLAIHHPEDGLQLYGALNTHTLYGVSVWRAAVPRSWDGLYNSLGTLVATDKPWDEQAVANVTQSTIGIATKIAVAAAFTTGMAASQDFTAVDISQGNQLGFVIYSTVATSAGDLQLQISDTLLVGGTSKDMDIPALAANTWTWVTLDCALNAQDTPDGTAIISAGINVVTDNGAQDIYLFGGIQVLGEYLEFTSLPANTRINKLVPYGGNETDPRVNPWVITERGIYEIQTDNNGIAVALPIGEISALQSEENGRATAVNDVYLFFNLTRKLERYYARNLDDIGPDKDDGLPNNRSGTPSVMVSYPGRVFLAIDGGASNYSSVLMQQGTAWQEVYRAPQTGRRIQDIYFQSIRGSATGRLWISEGSDILWVPVSLNPWTDTDYRFRHEGSLTMSYMYGGMQDVIKLWNSLKLFMDRKSGGTAEYIQADYRLDGDSAWTALTGSFDTIPIEEIDFSSASPPTARGRRIQIRLRLYTNNNLYTARVKAAVLEAIAFVPAKYGFSMNAVIAEDEHDIDLEGHEDTTFASVAAKVTQLNTWLAEGRALTFRCVYEPFDNKIVYLDPQAMRPLELWKDNAPGDAHEKHIISLTVNEL